MSALIAELKIWICLAPVEFIWKCVRKTSRLHKRDISEWEQVSLVSYVGFPATAGEIEVQRHTQLLKGLEFITESLSGKLPQRVLIPLSRFLHLPPLRERESSSITQIILTQPLTSALITITQYVIISNPFSPGLKLSALIRSVEIIVLIFILISVQTLISHIKTHLWNTWLLLVSLNISEIMLNFSLTPSTLSLSLYIYSTHLIIINISLAPSTLLAGSCVSKLYNCYIFSSI